MISCLSSVVTMPLLLPFSRYWHIFAKIVGGHMTLTHPYYDILACIVLYFLRTTCKPNFVALRCCAVSVFCAVNSRESSVATETKEVFTFSISFTALSLPSKVLYWALYTTLSCFILRTALHILTKVYLPMKIVYKYVCSRTKAPKRALAAWMRPRGEWIFWGCARWEKQTDG